MVARVFSVDDRDDTGPEPRFDVTVHHNGEAGSGGQLKRLRQEQIDALIDALQQMRREMGGSSFSGALQAELSRLPEPMRHQREEELRAQGITTLEEAGRFFAERNIKAWEW